MTQQSTTTNQSGAFQFKRVPPGKYQVQVSFQGFEPATVDVIVGGQPLAPLQITMEIASLHQESTVTSEPATRLKSFPGLLVASISKRWRRSKSERPYSPARS